LFLGDVIEKQSGSCFKVNHMFGSKVKGQRSNVNVARDGHLGPKSPYPTDVTSLRINVIKTS